MSDKRQGQGQLLNEEQFFQMLRDSIPPKRSFAVYRRVMDETDRPNVVSVRMGEYKEFERIIVEAHHRGLDDSGGIEFVVQTFQEKGQQGPGIYSRVIYTIAPGMWFDCRELTEDMQMRPSAVN